MSKKTIRHLVISIILLVTALGAFIYTLLEVEHQNEVLQQQVETIAKRQAQESAYFRLQRVAEESSEDREQLAGYFFKKESDSIDFLNLIESLAPENRLDLTVESLNEVPAASNQLPKVVIGLSFNGTYDDVTSFLKVIESLPYVSKVTQVTLAARSSTNWEAAVEVAVNIYAYEE